MYIVRGKTRQIFSLSVAKYEGFHMQTTMHTKENVHEVNLPVEESGEVIKRSGEEERGM